jgi:hypothetical protein
MVSPTLGRVLLTALVTARSACCGVSVVPERLLSGSGSNWSLWLIEARLVCWAALTTRAWICSVCGAAGVTTPTVHRPAALS